MGRVVKNAQVSQERYVLSIPAVASPAASNGHSSAAVVRERKPEPEPEVAAAPSVDWEALRSDAEGLINAAEAHAESLITEAGERAKGLLEGAAAQAAEVAEEARRAGYQDGSEAGKRAVEQEMDEMLMTMRGLVDMARAERHKIIESAEPEIVKLAMGIAEDILHRVISLDDEVVVDMTKAAMARLLQHEIVTVRVNPADLERMREHREEVLALGDVKHMRIVEDQRVDRGGVVVETDSGSVDAKISTQVEEARRILHVESEEAVVSPLDADVPLESAARAS